MERKLLSLLFGFLCFLVGCVVYDKEGNVDQEATKQLNESYQKTAETIGQFAQSAAQGYQAYRQGSPQQQPQQQQQICPYCRNTFALLCPQCQGMRGFSCAACGGRGNVYGLMCAACYGRGGFPCASCAGAGTVPCPYH